MIIVGQVHQDYLSYNALLEQPKHVGLSFAIKWGTWLLLVLLFFGLNHWYNQKKQIEKELETGGSNTALNKLLGRFKRDKVEHIINENDASEPSTNAASKEVQTDPFASLRKKDKLRSYADVIIEKKHTNSQ